MGERSTESSQSPTVDTYQQKIELYKTYDVMTGVRIAATLGGFFGLMVLLVVYKSKCKSRSLSDENLEAAVAAAAVVDHHRILGKSFLGPPLTLPDPYLSNTTAENPPPYIQDSHRVNSVFNERDDETHEMDHFQMTGQNLLQVPSSRRSSRRPSSITCSSCDTSYLERRGSALEVGLPIPPPFTYKRNNLIEESWDFYYPIDIQVVQPTPDISPSESEISVSEKGREGCPRVPLASIGSSGLPATTTFERDCRSVGSDSVFLDEELVDTEDEAEEFSTDSDTESGRSAGAAVRRFSSPAPLPATSSSESDTVCAEDAHSRKVPVGDMTVSCDRLLRALRQTPASPPPAYLHYCTRSRETLF